MALKSYKMGELGNPTKIRYYKGFEVDARMKDLIAENTILRDTITKLNLRLIEQETFMRQL